MENNGVKKSGKAFTVTDCIILGLQLVVSVVFLMLVNKVLPMKYWFLLTGVIGIIFLLFSVLIFHYVRKISQFEGKKIAGRMNIKKWIVKIFSLILSIVLLVGSAAAGKGLGVLNEITDEKYQTQLINILVLQDSACEKVKDLDGKILGITSGIDKANTENLMIELEEKEKVSVEVAQASTVVDMAKALYDGDVDAIVLNEAYRGLIEDVYGTFSTDTRSIYQFELKEELKKEEVTVDVTNTPFNIYISGIDAYGKVSTVSRSDVNMIVTVNPITKQILMTSIPRDYYVELASFGVKDKLTHAGIYGVEESMSTLEQEFDIQLNYYARVNFTSLITIVDALGGINVYNDQSFTSYHTHDYYPKGEMYMDGETALEFVRERYNLANGDFDRVKNQQKVLAAMLKKAMSPAIIKNYTDLLDAASDSVVTSLSAKDIQSLIQMQLDDMATWEFEQISISGKGTTSSHCYSMPGQSVYVMQPNYDSVNKAVEKINHVLEAR